MCLIAAPSSQGRAYVSTKAWSKTRKGPFPSSYSSTQTTAICASITFFFNPQLPDVHGWGLGWVAKGCLHTPGRAPEHPLSGFARFRNSAHGSNVCRKGVEGACGPGTSLLQLPVVASVCQGCTTSGFHLNHCGFLSPRGNRAWGEGATMPRQLGISLPGQEFHCYSPIPANSDATK